MKVKEEEGSKLIRRLLACVTSWMIGSSLEKEGVEHKGAAYIFLNTFFERAILYLVSHFILYLTFSAL